MQFSDLSFWHVAKNGFPIVFSKCDLTGKGSDFFCKKKVSRKAKKPKIFPRAQIRKVPADPAPLPTPKAKLSRYLNRK